ncbi:hypothetical protein P280DRAFT_382330, partial [Massarina eburnea CBS 473.64]
AGPSCWIPKLRKPGLERDCTFYETTRTRTVYTDCGGCGLSTRMLGHGLPCLKMTTVPGVAYATVTACSTSP